MRRFRQGDAPVILYSPRGVKLYDFGLNRIIETDDEDLINLLLAMGAVEIPQEVPPVPQDLTEVAERINALSGRLSALEAALAGKVDKEINRALSSNDYGDADKSKLAALADIRTIGAGLALSGEGELTATGSGSSGGEAGLDAALTVSKTVGGLTSGKTYPAGVSLEAVLRDMLNPVEAPSLTNPTATLAGPATRLLEPGGTDTATLTVTFLRGGISPAYGTSGYRSGPATGYSLNGGAQQAGNTFTATVSESNKTFQATVAYAAGEQPKNSAGENYDTPLSAGYVNTNTLTWEFVDALWSNAADITAVAKDPLISRSVGTKTWTFPPQTVANPETFDVPAAWSVTGIEVLNDLSGKWEDCAAEFTVTDTQHDDAAGTPVAYKRYTDNRGYNAGPRSVRVKWS